ncbi:MAG: thioredoxin domain-containing protein [Bacteroidota bacterium]
MYNSPTTGKNSGSPKAVDKPIFSPMSDNTGFRNRLASESSPYLQQHAGNPVDWYPWSEEALQKARTENKPILVSIGYSTCHWCHVMERESFEDENIARYMNAHFVNIKIDREERPDLDQIYMEACQIMTGSGGWPLNCFLLPDGRPFYAGTYYPPRAAYNRSSWSQLIQGIVNAYQNKYEDVVAQAERLTGHIRSSGDTFVSPLSEIEAKDQVFTAKFADLIFERLEDNFDEENGGFGGAPKFPTSSPLHYLLAYSQRKGGEKSESHLLHTLDRIIRGGIYDQLGGGFARYATDEAWLIPHFEKMLYDNALLVSLLSSVYKRTGKILYRQAIEQTLTFIEREMQSEEGGFYTALDADSEGVEGKFYVWTQEEIDGILGEEAPYVASYFGVLPGGNWEGNNILWRPHEEEEFLKAVGLEAQNWADLLDKARQQLWQAREKRIRPGLDDKILLGWNALQCCAYAKAYEALGTEAYKEQALRSIRFLLDRFAVKSTGELLRVYKDGNARYDALLDDYAYFIAALEDVYRISMDTEWLELAGTYTEKAIELFGDDENPLFYYTAASQTDLILRQKEVYDGAQPSGNSTMAMNLERLGILLGREEWREKSKQMLLSMKQSVGRYPSSFGQWATSMLSQVGGTYELAVIGEGALDLAREWQKCDLPFHVLMASERPNDRFPLLKDKQLSKDTYIYVCKDYVCQYPVQSIEDAMELIRTNQDVSLRSATEH